MMALQLPAPTPPPTPEAVILSTGPSHDLVIGMTVIILIIVVGITLYPLIRALARRLEGRGAGGTDPAVLDRVGELEHRLAEAEERIDFNERMLAQREPVALPRDKAD
jgi:hypothetical protein